MRLQYLWHKENDAILQYYYKRQRNPTIHIYKKQEVTDTENNSVTLFLVWYIL